jgi:predicted DNA-binding transcriptional regulator AlpA
VPTLTIRQIAKLLDVSRQRAQILVRKADFPAPEETETRTIFRWNKADVLKWNEERRREKIPEIEIPKL